jgi:general secretion pathway protein B
MSYILDALRKSDQQRQHGATPTLLTAHGITAAPKRSAFLTYGLTAVLLVAAGIAIGWLRPWQSGPRASPAAVVALPPGQVASPLGQVLPERDKESAQTMPALNTGSGTPAGSATDAAPATAKQGLPATVAGETREAAVPAIAVAAKHAATGAAIATTPAGPVPGTAAQEKAVMTLAELPAAIRQDIPRMAISVHAYSANPGNRLVGINDQLLREGDTLAPGLRLDEITVDGMIFSYKGYRFRTGTRG